MLKYRGVCLAFLAHVTLSALLLVNQAVAGPRLIIHAVEPGVAKFHRLDNTFHPYAAGSAWQPYLLPKDADPMKISSFDNIDGSVTVVFRTLEELLDTVVLVAHARGQPVSVLNIHGHGVPGGMWFPRNSNFFESIECLAWRNTATGPDETSYNQYYTPLLPDDVRSIREMSMATASPLFSCISGLEAWKMAIQKNPEVREALAPDTRIRFLACAIAMGVAGDAFVRGIAALLLRPDAAGVVEAPVNFALGDWSMPKGVGFWDYLTDEQIARDANVYRANHRDSEIAQQGAILRVEGNGDGRWLARIIDHLSFLSLGYELSLGTSEITPLLIPNDARAPTRMRVPGTTVYVTNAEPDSEI